MKSAIFLCGPPASGKSTYRKSLVEQFPDAVILSTDDIIEFVAERQQTTYKAVWKDNIKIAQKLLEQRLVDAIENNQDIIWDQCLVSEKTRKSALSKIPNDYMKKVVVFQTNPVIIEANNQRRKEVGRDIPETVIKSMLETFTIPSKEEGFDSVEVRKWDV